MSYTNSSSSRGGPRQMPRTFNKTVKADIKSPPLLLGSYNSLPRLARSKQLLYMGCLPPSAALCTLHL
ncbi:hypothetical protein GQ602_004890 [Ophiocordyceps camponoti-floridani]|uniref:Uncharacterized protein n=1 Tax=Ophiocordyceps camponoti-floridani TaxID=2030778 RepID=A0A8H4VCG9_9HYPO|nr:hypothetical protein GQ602_004890 [Ophiocordyceps camponoti-floridani]